MVLPDRHPDVRIDPGARPRFSPAIPLVETRLQPALPRPGMIRRVRLLEILAAEPQPAIVSIVGPPGYGKTALLADWAASERRQVAWLTLDEQDNDPAVLLTYLAATFDRVEPIDGSILSAIAAHEQQILSNAVPRLASEMHRWRRPVVLILDDAHRLVDRTSLDALAVLLDHLPPHVQVAIAARTRPDLPFGRFRTRMGLLEIERTLLAFDEEEAGAAASAAGRHLTPDDARHLVDRTEGWPAAIYLATLSDGAAERNTGRIADVTGRRGFIAEYLQSELLATLGDEDVTFLARTSILDAVEPGVAEAVVGMPGASARLPSLARAYLLIAQVGAGEVSYRYHRLLRDYLEAELERREPGATKELHRRAASWYAAAGRLELAVDHAIASGDVDAAAGLVTRAAMPVYYAGRAATLDRWLRGFDGAVFERHPPLAAIAGWIDLLNGRPDAADRMADISERSTFTGPPGDGTASFESSRAMLRAIMARRGPEDVLANAAFAASRERPEDLWLANARYLLGSAHLLLGDMDAADAAFAGAGAASEVSGAPHPPAMAKRASIAMARGDWTAAERFVRGSHDLLTALHLDELLPALIVDAVGAREAVHRRDLAGARAHLVRAQLVRPLASHAAPWFAVDALLELARAYMAMADPAGARSVVREAQEILRRRPALGTLVTEFAEMRERVGNAASTLSGPSTLTAAELRLLPILPTYLSFQEIADRLFISRNTVKTQALSIYGKLHATSRSEAVERAVELGLLEPFPGLETVRRPPID
jgi:LuxR family maltose regulon positive regulatory protein